ncbi:hypothetical protein M0804_010424 [Polistes exclamans]|nr:hypothetical protein M0804_010424 [Polistes exclamans]
MYKERNKGQLVCLRRGGGRGRRGGGRRLRLRRGRGRCRRRPRRQDDVFADTTETRRGDATRRDAPDERCEESTLDCATERCLASTRVDIN